MGTPRSTFQWNDNQKSTGRSTHRQQVLGSIPLAERLFINPDRVCVGELAGIVAKKTRHGESGGGHAIVGCAIDAISGEIGVHPAVGRQSSKDLSACDGNSCIPCGARYPMPCASQSRPKVSILGCRKVMFLIGRWAR